MGVKKNSLVMFKVFIVGIMVTELCEGTIKPYKRMSDLLHHITLTSLSPVYLNGLIERTITRARERRGRVVSDAGYGSRVAAGSNIANAVMARHGLFGIHGPGKRKRRSVDSHDVIQQTPSKSYTR